MAKYQNFWSSILCAVARVFTVLPAVGRAYGGFYCRVWVLVSWSEHSSSIETDLESVEVPLEGTVVVLVKHQ